MEDAQGFQRAFRERIRRLSAWKRGAEIDQTGRREEPDGHGHGWSRTALPAIHEPVANRYSAPASNQMSIAFNDSETTLRYASLFPADVSRGSRVLATRLYRLRDTFPREILNARWFFEYRRFGQSRQTFRVSIRRRNRSPVMDLSGETFDPLNRGI